MHLACGTGMQSAGVQRHIAELASGLRVRGHRSWVVCPPRSWLHRELRMGVEQIPWSGQLLRRRAEFSAVSRLMLKESIPIIHAHNRASVRVALELRRRYPCHLVATAHTMVPYPEYREVDHILAVSHAVVDCLRESGTTANRPIDMIYGGVDMDRFCPNPSSRAALRQELGLDASTPVVVTVCRLGKKTSVRYFLEAAARVRKHRPDAHFVLAGDGPFLARHEALRHRRALGLECSVSFLGDREDVPEILAAADVFALCSTREALGLAALEAMACRVPVVATRVGGLVETLVNDESGYLVDPTGEAIAARVLELLNNPARAAELAAAGRDRARARFHLAGTVDLHEQFYAGLAP